MSGVLGGDGSLQSSHLASPSMDFLSYEWAGYKAFGVPVALACLGQQSSFHPVNQGCL